MVNKVSVSIPLNLFSQSKERVNTEKNKPEFEKECTVLKSSIDTAKHAEGVVNSLAVKFPESFNLAIPIPKTNNGSSRAPFEKELLHKVDKAMGFKFSNIPSIDKRRVKSHIQRLVMHKLDTKIKAHAKPNDHISVTRSEMTDVFRLHFSAGCNVPVYEAKQGRQIKSPQKRASLQTPEIKKAPLPKQLSTVNHVKELLLTPNKRFELKKFAGTPNTRFVVETIMKKAGIKPNPDGSISPEQLRSIVSLYPETAMEVNLQRLGQWDAFKKQFPTYKERFSKLWNVEAISKSFEQKGTNALSIAGVTYGLTTVFGLGGDNSNILGEVTNLNAWKNSAKKPWKLWLAAGLGAQVSGVPLMETGGLALRFGFNTLGRVAYTGAAIFDSLLSPSNWGQIIAGGEVKRPTPAELMKLLPVITGHLKPDHQKLLSKFYEEKTGEKLVLSHQEIDKIAQLTVASSDALIANGEPNTLESKPWKQAMLQSIVDISALAIARHPNHNYRFQFEQAVNKYMDKRKAQINNPHKKDLYRPLFKNVGGVEKGLIADVIDNKAFDDKFEKGAKQILSKMNPNQRKSILQMATSHGLSGLLVMAWIFIQGSLSFLQLGMHVGGKILGPKDKKGSPDKKKEGAEKANKLLSRTDEQLEKVTAKEWKEFVGDIKTAEVIKGSVSNLKSLKKDDYVSVLKKLKKEGFSIKSNEDLKEFAKMQSEFKDIVNSVKEKTIKAIALGEINRKRESSLKDLYYFDKGLKKFLDSSVVNYDLNANGLFGTLKNYLFKNPVKFTKKRGSWAGKRFRNLAKGKVTTTGAANSILRDLGVPESRLTTIKETDKANKNRIIEIRKLISEVLGTYESNGGKAILAELEK